MLFFETRSTQTSSVGGVAEVVGMGLGLIGGAGQVGPAPEVLVNDSEDNTERLDNKAVSKRHLMCSLRFIAETPSNGLIERDFTVGEVTGVLWSPASGADRAPMVLMGHCGGQHRKAPAMAGRARRPVTSCGFHVGRRAHRPASRPGVVRRPRLEGKEFARQRGRAQGTTQVRGR